MVIKMIAIHLLTTLDHTITTQREYLAIRGVKMPLLRGTRICNFVSILPLCYLEGLTSYEVVDAPSCINTHNASVLPYSAHLCTGNRQSCSHPVRRFIPDASSFPIGIVANALSFSTVFSKQGSKCNNH